jgi:hypothetical protein
LRFSIRFPPESIIHIVPESVSTSLRNRYSHAPEYAKGPRFSRQIGVTPILEAEQMRALLDSIPVTREVKIPRKHGGA